MATWIVARLPQSWFPAGAFNARNLEQRHKGSHMYKFIGGVVVYGFALLGLAVYLDRAHGDGRLFTDD